MSSPSQTPPLIPCPNNPPIHPTADRAAPPFPHRRPTSPVDRPPTPSHPRRLTTRPPAPPRALPPRPPFPHGRRSARKAPNRQKRGRWIDPTSHPARAPIPCTAPSHPQGPSPLPPAPPSHRSPRGARQRGAGWPPARAPSPKPPRSSLPHPSSVIPHGITRARGRPTSPPRPAPRSRFRVSGRADRPVSAAQCSDTGRSRTAGGSCPGPAAPGAPRCRSD